MGSGTKYNCKVCGKGSTAYSGKGMMYLGVENLYSEYSSVSKAVAKHIYKALETPGSEFEWLGQNVFSCSKCHRWRSETDWRVLGADGEVVLQAKYKCGHCRSYFDGDESEKETCGACGVELEWGVNCDVYDVMWD